MSELIEVPIKSENGEEDVLLMTREQLDAIENFLANPETGVRRERPARRVVES